MVSDRENGGVSTALLSTLTSITQSLGRVEAGQLANRQTVVDMAQSLHIRMEDMRRELHGRMDRIETVKTTRIPMAWLLKNWRVGLYAGAVALFLLGKMNMTELKAALFGLRH